MKHRRLLAFALVLAVPLLGGWGKNLDQELLRVFESLQGEYSAEAPMEDARLHISPVFAPFLGENVLYVELTDPSGQIRSQQLYALTVGKRAIVQRTFSLKEPQRWARGHERPDIFRGLVSDDVTATAACDLGWVFDKKTKVLTGISPVKSCRVQRVELNGNELKIDEAARGVAVAMVFRRDGAE